MIEPHYQDDAATLYLGNSAIVLTELGESSVDAIVCDPPYELGFMGKGWDASGIAYSVPLWTAALRVLKPGGHLIAFGGTRTYHRMTCAIEDAGFQIRDCLAWLYGSGFPKSLNISKAIDKAAGAEREVVGTYKGASNIGKESTNSYITAESGHATDVSITAPATPEAMEWQGWGTALKPAFEPAVLARKPFSGTVAANVLLYGTGGINVDACRLEGQAESFADNRIEKRNTVFSPFNPSDYDGSKGRWPANVILDDEAGVMVDALGREGGLQVGHADFGGASRFFYCAKADSHDRVDGDHPTVKPGDLMRWLVRLVTPPSGTVLDCFAGSGSTLEAAVAENRRCIGIEMDPHYADIIIRRLERPIPVAMFDV